MAQFSDAGWPGMAESVQSLIGRLRHWLGFSSIQELFAAVQNPETLLRARALYKLGWPDNLEIQARIINATRDADPAVHDMAMLTLLGLRRPRADYIQQAIAAAGIPRESPKANQVFTSLQEHIDLLLKHTLYPADSEEYTYTIAAFRKMGACTLPGLLHYFETGVSDETAELAIEYRPQAAHVLGQLGELSVIPALIDLLEKTQRDIRRAVIAALGQLRDVRAVPP